MVVPVSDRSYKKRSGNDRWPQLAVAQNNTSLDSEKDVFMCEGLVDHHTQFFFFLKSLKAFVETVTLPDLSCLAAANVLASIYRTI